MGRKKKNTSQGTGARILTIVISYALAGLLLFGLFQKAGSIGNGIFDIAQSGIGKTGAFLLAIILLGLGTYIAIQRKRPPILDAIMITLLFVNIVGFVEVLPFTNEAAGGLLGVQLAAIVIQAFDIYLGLIIQCVIALVLAMILVRRQPFLLEIAHNIRDRFSREEEELEDEEDEDEENEEDEEDEEESPKPKKRKLAIKGLGSKKPEEAIDIKDPIPVVDGDYTFPPLTLLSKTSGKPAVGDIEENAHLIQKTLQNFNIEVEMDEVTVGPTITRYALKPAAGIKLSKIVGLQNNLELALASHIRIEAPIPGKSLVGIEIPNSKKSTIGLGSVFREQEFQSSQKPLWISIGKTVDNQTVFQSITKFPHLLIAGATGAGKSVTVHNIIISLLYRHGPAELRFIMVDPKRVELTLYNKIPHLLTPIIKDAKKAILALKWAVKEMERRYDILESVRVRDIDSYHKKIVKPAYEKSDDPEEDDLPERMPYIIVIMDELADIMQAYPRELESAIVRLAQMSRAVGIHLILSTQRPSVNVITGLIKANIPARIALRASSQVDSRTILDVSGAEKLLGAGDMLFASGDMAKPERVQCPYISEEEVKKVAKFIVDNNTSIPDEISLPETIDADRAIASGSFEDDEAEDELYEDARELVIRAGKASTSYIQRKLRVGYSRAARLIDILEEHGVVGPAEGSKPRKVLVEKGGETDGDDEDYEEDEE